MHECRRIHQSLLQFCWAAKTTKAERITVKATIIASFLFFNGRRFNYYIINVCCYPILLAPLVVT